MIRVALRGLAGRKLRAALTALAVVLGVAMVSGTYILTDTISKAFDTIFTDSYAGTDAVVAGEKVVEFSQSGRATVPEDLLARVREVPEVAAASGGIQDLATKIIGRDGKAIDTQGAPTFGFSFDAEHPEFNPLTLVEGRWPAGPSEVVIDAGTADDEGYDVGETVGIASRGPVRDFEVVGVARFGSVDSIGSATFAIFDVPTAQALYGKEGRFDGISVAAAPGVPPEELVEALEPVVPDRFVVQTAAAQAEEDSAETREALGIVQSFLLAFGGIALFVGAFVIFNTLSITVAQRAREFATLRTLGASRRQVLGSVVLESLVLGVVASVVGLFAGLGLAVGLNAIFVSAGIELPQTDPVFAARTVVVSLLVGTLVTLLAGTAPAIRATRVPPITAVREGATLPRSPLARFVPLGAGLGGAAGIALLVYGMFAGGVETTQRLLSLGAGCLALFVAVALVSPRLVRPLASALGWPGRRLAGVPGSLARENAMRDPGRTAATAAALMIGLALVVFVAVLGAGLRASVGEAIDRQVRSDFVVTAQDNFSPVPAQAGRAVAAVPGVGLAASVRQDYARSAAEEEQVAGIPPAFAEAFDIEWKHGSDALVAELGANGAVVEEDTAADLGVGIGDTFALTTPQGREIELVVRGIRRQPEFSVWLGSILMGQEAFDAAFPRAGDVFTFVRAPAQARPEVERALAGFPDAKLQSKAEFADNQIEGLDILLNLLYVLLALSVVVSLFGMVNTLVLSVFERTRELGLLRAVGMTRWQARWMITHESVVTALIGGAIGAALGIFLAALVTGALSEEGVVFALPAGTLVAITIATVLAGVLAAIVPARRAARLNVLEALQYE